MIKLKITQRTEENHFDQEIDLKYADFCPEVYALMEEVLNHSCGNTRVEVRKEDSGE